MLTNNNFNLILPTGTHVITLIETKSNGADYPRGAVGVIEQAALDATQSYIVRLTDGATVSLRRVEFSIRKHAQNDMSEASAEAIGECDLRQFVIYSCVTGSQAYGLATNQSDTDVRGIYLPPAALHWSLYGVPEQLEDRAREEVFWETGKFLTLALKANPNVLECLYTPMYEAKHELANKLLAMRDAFLSQLVYQTFNGYVLSQFKKLEQDLRTTGEIKSKHAMHLIRLLLAGVSILRDATLQVDVGEHRAELLAIRRGEIAWDEINKWRLALHKDFDAALSATRLPERPDYKRVNDFLIHARRTAANKDYLIETK